MRCEERRSPNDNDVECNTMCYYLFTMWRRVMFLAITDARLELYSACDVRFVWRQLRGWERCQCALKFVAPGALSVEEYLQEEDEAGEQKIACAPGERGFSALCATFSSMHCCIQTILHIAVHSRKGIVQILRMWTRPDWSSRVICSLCQIEVKLILLTIRGTTS